MGPGLGPILGVPSRREAARDDAEEVQLVPFCATSHDRFGAAGPERDGIDGATQMVCDVVEAGLGPS